MTSCPNIKTGDIMYYKDILDKNLAIINILITYCEANVEEPTSESIFDILVGLNELKNNSNELRKILFKDD